LGYISVAESLAISSTTFMQCAPKVTAFAEITQNEMAIFCVLYLQRAACSTFQTCILNSH